MLKDFLRLRIQSLTSYPASAYHECALQVVLSKTKEVCQPMMEQFMRGLVKKEYLCVVDGCWSQQPGSSFVVDSPIQRAHIKYVREIGDSKEDSKPARTIYTILDKSESKQMMLLRAAPQTGRTHQIRVHAASKSLPIIGDDLYNPKEFVSESAPLPQRDLCTVGT